MMLRSMTSMRGFTIRATDGDVGSVDDFLFDDATWTLRYLVANTGGWLSDRLVLLSPIAFRAIHWEQRQFALDLSCRQIEQSPSIAEDLPVSRQKEEEYLRYYGYAYYWAGPGLWGGGMYPQALAMQGASPALDDAADGQDDDRPRGDPHLRSAREVAKYKIHARDGDLGHVADFLADDATWAIRSIVVDTRNWWPGKKVLIARERITQVSWEQSCVAVDLRRDAIRHGSEYKPAQLE